MSLQIGSVLFGYCGGEFGRGSYGNKRIEAMGIDWVVCRDERGNVCFGYGSPEEFEQYSVIPPRPVIGEPAYRGITTSYLIGEWEVQEWDLTYKEEHERRNG